MQGMDYSEVRGFNYQPSYGSHGLEIWGPGFNIDLIRTELGRGKGFFPGINTIRLWLSHDAYIRYPSEVPGRFGEVVELADEFDLRFIVTLFNGWHSLPEFGGISASMLREWMDKERLGEAFGAYIDAIVGEYANDERILMWDLCNEPFNNAMCAESTSLIFRWLEWVYKACKDCGAKAPITVGSTPIMDSIRKLEAISDVITFHPYFAWNDWVKSVEEFEAFLDEAVMFGKSVNKPMLVTETCWGSLDDKKRAEVMSVELGALARRGLGFTAHVLHHTLVADGHRPEYGPITNAGYMAFVEQDGSLRRYHDVFNDF